MLGLSQFLNQKARYKHVLCFNIFLNLRLQENMLFDDDLNVFNLFNLLYPNHRPSPGFI
jgi:hypothetical protein